MDPLEALKPEVREKLRSHGIKDLEHLATQYVTQHDHLERSVRVPGKDSTPEERASFAKKMGVPDTSEGYSIPEGARESQLGQTLRELRSIAHGRSIPAESWDALVSGATALEQAAVARQRAELDEMRRDWDQAAARELGSKIDRARIHTDRVMSELKKSDPRLARILETVPLDRHPAVVKAFFQTGEITSPDTAPVGFEGRTVQQPIDEARALRAGVLEIVASEEYKRKNHPKHEVVMQAFFDKQKRLSELGFQGATDPRLQPA